MAGESNASLPHANAGRTDSIKSKITLLSAVLWQNMSRTPRRPSPPAAPGLHSGTPTATRTSRSRTGDGVGSPVRKRQPATEFCCESTRRDTRKVRRSTEWCIAPSSTRKPSATTGSTPWRTKPSPTSTPGDANYTPDYEVTGNPFHGSCDGPPAPTTHSTMPRLPGR